MKSCWRRKRRKRNLNWNSPEQQKRRKNKLRKGEGQRPTRSSSRRTLLIWPASAGLWSAAVWHPSRRPWWWSWWRSTRRPSPWPSGMGPMMWTWSKVRQLPSSLARTDLLWPAPAVSPLSLSVRRLFHLLCCHGASSFCACFPFWGSTLGNG